MVLKNKILKIQVIFFFWSGFSGAVFLERFFWSTNGMLMNLSGSSKKEAGNGVFWGVMLDNSPTSQANIPVSQLCA